MTKVKFLIELPEGDLPCNVYAYFPEIIGDNKGNKTCYAHIGQHSACSPDYANECKEAQYNQYADLLRELIGQGYNDLIVLNTQQINCHREPTKTEIGFGYGGTMYREFYISDLLNKKGKIKKWFVCPDDHQRYYTN